MGVFVVNFTANIHNYSIDYNIDNFFQLKYIYCIGNIVVKMFNIKLQFITLCYKKYQVSLNFTFETIKVQNR